MAGVGGMVYTIHKCSSGLPCSSGGARACPHALAFSRLMVTKVSSRWEMFSFFFSIFILERGPHGTKTPRPKRALLSGKSPQRVSFPSFSGSCAGPHSFAIRLLLHIPSATRSGSDLYLRPQLELSAVNSTKFNTMSLLGYKSSVGTAQVGESTCGVLCIYSAQDT